VLSYTTERIKTFSDFKSSKKHVKFLLLNYFLYVQLRNFCSFADLSFGDTNLYIM